MKKTKIVCTISDFINKPEILNKLIDRGMNVVRINFSHSDHRGALNMIEKIKNIRKNRDTSLSIMIDTKGPEVRVFGYNEKIYLKKNDEITVKSSIEKDLADVVSEKKYEFFTNLPEIDKIIEIGENVLLMDGYFKCTVIDKNDNSVKLQIFNEGYLRPKAHLTVPKKDNKLPFLSEKDKQDIIFSVDNNVDYLALSFVRNLKNIEKVRELIQERNPQSEIKIISKIENKQSIDNLDEIIENSDGIIVARGDLGVELDIEEVPILQKKIIRKCYQSGKPVIVATQMLETMIENPIPTRAEVSDVANACYELTSAVMLSGETAVGKYPDLVVETMNRIIDQAEEDINYVELFNIRKNNIITSDLTRVISFAAVETAYRSNAKAIIAMTKSGYTARMIAALRPKLPIFAFTTSENTYQQLALVWGVSAYHLEEEKNCEDLIDKVIQLCKQKNLVEISNTLVIVAGLPLGITGKTNMIRVKIVE
ncbi:MAG: pyruvate kinase [bacterium]